MYVNDLPDICTNDIDLYLFADDAKICKYTSNGEDQAELQTTLSKMQTCVKCGSEGMRECGSEYS